MVQSAVDDRAKARRTYYLGPAKAISSRGDTAPGQTFFASSAALPM
jgi:hypothetical protein